MRTIIPVSDTPLLLYVMIKWRPGVLYGGQGRRRGGRIVKKCIPSGKKVENSCFPFSVASHHREGNENDFFFNFLFVKFWWKKKWERFLYQCVYYKEVVLWAAFKTSKWHFGLYCTHAYVRKCTFIVEEVLKLVLGIHEECAKMSMTQRRSWPVSKTKITFQCSYPKRASEIWARANVACSYNTNHMVIVCYTEKTANHNSSIISSLNLEINKMTNKSKTCRLTFRKVKSVARCPPSYIYI